MPVVKTPNVKAKVLIREFERGYGERLEDTIYFDNFDEAVQYAKNYNEKEWAENDKLYGPDVVPDCYYQAEASRVS